MNARTAVMWLRERFNWPSLLRTVVWYAAMQVMWQFLEWFLEPIIGFWPTWFAGFAVAYITIRWLLTNERNKEPHTGKFWWVWWDHKDAQAWNAMTDAEKAICSAYRVPPALMPTKRPGTYQNALEEQRQWLRDRGLPPDDE